MTSLAAVHQKTPVNRLSALFFGDEAEDTSRRDLVFNISHVKISKNIRLCAALSGDTAVQNITGV